MRLLQIAIKNYKSIKEVVIDLCPSSDATFGFLGLNEVGKSNILKFIFLMDASQNILDSDFRDKSLPIEVLFNYQIEPASESDDWVIECIRNAGKNKDGESEAAPTTTTSGNINLDGAMDVVQLKLIIKLEDKKKELYLVQMGNEIVASDMDLNSHFYQPVFWAAEPKYLISNSVDLESFAGSPESVSIPLRNCFLLAGKNDIKSCIAELKNQPADIDFLCKTLGRAVTKHINSVWPGHAISIDFNINNNAITFLVNDDSVEEKAKTVGQRSDGFRQFISFLLTVSAANKNKELSKTILLLDEPETHLHPSAQELLLNELIKISENDRLNIVLFATHSNHMIDKKRIGRYFKVTKENDVTGLSDVALTLQTYAGVAYDIFGVGGSDYFCELYSRIYDEYLMELKEEETGGVKHGIKNFDNNYLKDKTGGIPPNQ
jgi:predicted ATP-dependent endonuclease of OLD family